MGKFLFIAAITAALGAAAPALAQSEADADSGEIFVEGRKLDNQVRRFIDGLAASEFTGQIGQFHRPICPRSVGLGEVQNRQVVERMRVVAAAAGIPVAPLNCGANVLVVVTADKAAVIESWKKNQPEMFGSLPRHEIRRLSHGRAPAAAWQIESLVDEDGVQVERDTEGVFRFASSEGGSRLINGTRPTFLASIVLVDVAALGGVSTRELADYAAVRAFSRTDPLRAANATSLGAPTILTFFEDRAAGREPPLSLTQWDLSFLKSLYATSNAYSAVRQRNAMKRVLKRDLQQATARQE